jgi:hypothetical protein
MEPGLKVLRHYYIVMCFNIGIRDVSRSLVHLAYFSDVDADDDRLFASLREIVLHNEGFCHCGVHLPPSNPLFVPNVIFFL